MEVRENEALDEFHNEQQYTSGSVQHVRLSQVALVRLQTDAMSCGVQQNSATTQR